MSIPRVVYTEGMLFILMDCCPNQDIAVYSISLILIPGNDFCDMEQCISCGINLDPRVPFLHHPTLLEDLCLS